MPKQKINSPDDYERFVETTIKPWSPEQRMALAAATAERWLPVYEAFSEREEWGDPAILRRALEAVWGNVLGRSLSSKELKRYSAQLEEVSPHLDDFDAEDAIAVPWTIYYALRCCGKPNNVVDTFMALGSAFEAVAPGIYSGDGEEDLEPDVWERISVQQELAKQLRVIEQIQAIAQFDHQTLEALRRGLTTPELVGEELPRKPCRVPPRLTNQEAFEQYRSSLEYYLSLGDAEEFNRQFRDGTHGLAFPRWVNRYARRKECIENMERPLADVTAREALLTCLRARDAAVKEPLNWDQQALSFIENALRFPYTGLDVTSLEETHAYGPSLRRLWADAKSRGLSDSDAWNIILDWSIHRPAAWDAEDLRKKKGLTYSIPDLGQHLASQVSWLTTDDPCHPWSAEVDGQQWRIRLNDFPDDLMYSLLIGGGRVGDFHDWPETWLRKETAPSISSSRLQPPLNLPTVVFGGETFVFGGGSETDIEELKSSPEMKALDSVLKRLKKML
jgi:uncharacterized protein YjaG (DUF416 family)